MDTNQIDGEITDLLVMRRGCLMPTYYIKNILRAKHPQLETPQVLRRLKSLEKAGRVQRVPTDYATMICWGIAAVPAARPVDPDDKIDGDAAEFAENGL